MFYEMDEEIKQQILETDKLLVRLREESPYDWFVLRHIKVYCTDPLNWDWKEARFAKMMEDLMTDEKLLKKFTEKEGIAKTSCLYKQKWAKDWADPAWEATTPWKKLPEKFFWKEIVSFLPQVTIGICDQITKNGDEDDSQRLNNTNLLLNTLRMGNVFLFPTQKLICSLNFYGIMKEFFIKVSKLVYPRRKVMLVLKVVCKPGKEKRNGLDCSYYHIMFEFVGEPNISFAIKEFSRMHMYVERNEKQQSLYTLGSSLSLVMAGTHHYRLHNLHVRNGLKTYHRFLSCFLRHLRKNVNYRTNHACSINDDIVCVLNDVYYDNDESNSE